MTIPLVDLKTQYQILRPRILERINRVLDHGCYIMGPEVQELEEKLSDYVGSKHCITVASGTEALLISLMALGIKPGDEVIVTPFTFVASVEVIVRLGAIPIFVDIERDTCNLDAKKLAERISPKTRAIISVSLYGQPADMNEINLIAARAGDIPVIEDAAQSFGAIYNNKRSCNLSTIGCTSFFPSKTLGSYGDGGAIFTQDDSIAKVCREIRIHGQISPYVHTRLGVGGRMDTIQCAVVLAKFEHFEWEIQERIKIGQRYNQLLSTIRFEKPAEICPITVRKNRSSVYSQYTLLCADRDLVQKKLKQANVTTAVYYPTPVNNQAAYKDLCCEDCTPVAKELSRCVISLPMHPYLSAEMQQYITECIKNLDSY